MPLFSFPFLLKAHKLLRNSPDFRWCKNAQCGSGQESINGTEHPIVQCHSCAARSCFIHDTPWHEGRTCAQQDAFVDEEASGEAATHQWMEAHTKKCPTCRSPIEKNDGCDHMTCNKYSGGCGGEFCWRCMAPYEPILRDGNHRHQPTCLYYAHFSDDEDDEE